MYCTRCGTPLRPDARFCTSCGSSVALSVISVPEDAAPVKKESPVWGICCLILSLIALLILFSGGMPVTLIGILISFLSLVFSLPALRRSTSRAMGILGLCLSAFNMIFGVVYIVLLLPLV